MTFGWLISKGISIWPGQRSSGTNKWLEELSILNALPVTPDSKHQCKKYEKKAHVRHPHDDIHSIQAKQQPRRRQWRGLRFWTTNYWTVLTAAWSCWIIHGLITAFGSVIHRIHSMDRNIYDKSQVAEPAYYQEKFRPSQLSELTLYMKAPSPYIG